MSRFFSSFQEAALAVGVEELEEGKDQHKKCTAKS
jgi:hypothetical protein